MIDYFIDEGFVLSTGGTGGSEPTVCECPIDFDTAGQVPGEMPSELSAATYIELIVATKVIGTTNVRPACNGRICGQVVGFNIERDLFDPHKYVTVKAIALIKRVVLANYAPYLRDFNTNTISPVDLEVVPVTRMSVLLLDLTFTPAEARRVLEHLARHREILPSRVAR